MPVIELSGGPVEYRRIDGSADLDPLVFLHEGLGCVATWGRFPDRVAESTGRSAVIYSRHGYGGSGPTTTRRYSDYMHDEAYDVLPELITRLELRPPVLIGHSDGASISLLHASGQPAAGLVLIAPHVFVESETLHGIRTIRAAYRSGGLREHLSWLHDDPDFTFWRWTDVWMSAEFRGWNIEAELADIGCPVLLVQGKGDQYGTTAQLDAIERAVRGPVQRVEIADCGHAPHLEHADEVHRAVTTFLRASVTAREPVQ